MKFFFKIVFAIAFLLIETGNSFANTPIVFEGENLIIGKYLHIYEDKTERLSIDKVQGMAFEQSTVQTPNLKLNKSDFWIKFTVKNNSDSENLLLMIDYPSLDKCELYTQIEDGFTKQTISDTSRFSERKYNHQSFIFDIKIPTDSSINYYLKVNSSEQMILPVVLGTPKDIAEKLLRHDLFWGIWIGIVLVMIFYNLFLFLSTKDKSYLYYVLYTAFISLTQTSLSGYTYRFIFYNTPDLYNKALVIFPGLAGIFAVLFVKSFLITKQKAPFLNKLFVPILILYASAIILRIFNYDIASYRMIDYAALSISLLIYTTAIKISLQGYRPARYFLLAWTMFLLGLIMFSLRNLELVPDNMFTNYTMQIGIAFEVALLSLALADKINILKKEKEESQAQALQAAMENERIIKEQNIVLEQRVNERTAELKEANEELTITLEDLKQTQSQLVAAEKMASLGQLTAGIAHEINNPINFVTSNVSPLQRDVKMLIQTIETYEEMIFSDQDTEEKRQQIEEHKEDLDYDYLKIEIDHLLKGINEGASRTAEIVKGLRIFSRVDEDDLKMANILEGLDSTLVIMNSLINSSNISVTRHYEENIPQVECYPGKLNQVFLNIISNSIYAINQVHKNNGNGNIDISVKAENDTIIIDMKDNGCGIAKHNLTKIFDPFFTTKDVGEGTGLGMSIAYNTIKKHNGNIELFSEVAKGTLIRITLPVKQNAVSSQTT